MRLKTITLAKGHLKNEKLIKNSKSNPFFQHPKRVCVPQTNIQYNYMSLTLVTPCILKKI